MKISISSIPQIYRNLKRWREILSVLSKFGLADWLSRINVEFVKDYMKTPDGEALARLSFETRIRLALTELGPTFIKIGQLLSTRPDTVGAALADELKKLQCDAPATEFSQIRKTLESELGEPIDHVFAEFEEVPMASAWIGQVHRARLKDGEPVAVKVQHEGICHKIRDDLEIMSGVAQIAERFEEFKPYRPDALMAELGRSLRRELDFGREERNLQQFAALLANDATVHIPEPVTELCTSRVLTMAFIDGVKLSDRQGLAGAGLDRNELARRGADLYLRMIFKNGFYHADPHPGNIVVLPGNVIGLLDFGMVGRINERLREDIEEMLMCLVTQDVPTLTMLIKRIGSAPFDLDDSALANDAAEYIGHYATQCLDDLDLNSALREMTEVMRRHHIALPTDASMLIQVLAKLDGTGKLLNPKFSLMEMMKPFHRTLFLRRFSPLRQARKIRRLYLEFEQLVEVLPQRVMSILEQIQSGKFDVHLDHRRLGPSINRLVLGLMTSALFLGSALMLSYKVPPLLFPENPFWGMHQLSLLGLAGCTFSILLGMRLVYAIRKSGNLDKQDQ